ncbi:MAG TPA: hypothetical protein VK459_13665 [Polyangiaceae bacterium]|jgi:hypothetical protein|nr:hypothetical protein [Polyangiaceae bacterium]
MGKNVIVSEQTVRDLLEAHASLSAWYYELWAALRAGTAPRPPDDAARSAFVERLASDFPEIASVARAIQVPRMFVPPPPSYAVPPAAVESPLAESRAEPSPAAVAPAPQPTADPGIAPPPIVVPDKVKYET